MEVKREIQVLALRVSFESSNYLWYNLTIMYSFTTFINKHRSCADKTPGTVLGNRKTRTNYKQRYA